MKNHPLYASRTLARLYAAQGYTRQAEIICARLRETARPGETQMADPMADSGSPAADETTVSELAGRMARWLDLVARYRFYKKDRYPKI
ncbi:MAG: hypothetical protein R6U97_10465 [Desulfosalsimonas sp.]|uniref:hypothetical protein n=1 Tax=Desulfosalsimonas sp. TaxID=3073848 RepID=UPI003970ECAC